MSLVDELKGLFSDWVRDAPDAAVDTRSAVRYLVERGALQPEGQVYWVTQGLHGFIYVASGRSRRASPVDALAGCRRPIVGKVASTFLFDPYRRPFRFVGKTSRLVSAWFEARVAEERQPFDTGMKELRRIADALLTDTRAATSRGDVAAATTLQAQHTMLHAQLQANDAALLAAQQVLAQVREALRSALKPLKRRIFPTIDLFLQSAHAALCPALATIYGGDVAAAQQRAYALINQLFAGIAHGNSLRRSWQREIWPIAANDSWRQRDDQTLGLMVDCMLRAGRPYAFAPHELLPNSPTGPTPTAAQRRAGRRAAATFRLVLQPVRHESVRQAFRQLLLGAWYMDDRLQRQTALSPAVVQALPPKSPEVVQAHQESLRQRSLEALAQPLTVRDPILAARVETGRQEQRRRIAAQRDFPVFAHVPWRVDAKEAEEVRKEHCVTFANLPLGDEHVANCNSVAAALLDLAAAIETKEKDEVVVAHYRGHVRNFGHKHVPKLPRPGL